MLEDMPRELLYKVFNLDYRDWLALRGIL